jgi:KaiC/GvpD/RAD55 family RecA-like ATPase
MTTKTQELKFERAIDIIKKVESDPEPKFLWHGIPEGSKGIITGVAKTGKTTLAENLAISLSTGKREFMGFPLIGEPQKVLFINLEESERLFARRNLKQISELSKSELNLFNENYLCAPSSFPEFFTTDKDWLCLRGIIIDSKAKVVIIDSLTHMFDGEIEKSNPAKKFIEKLRGTFKDLDVTLIIVHHNTKGNNSPITQDNIAGSRVILQEFEFAIGLANVPTGAGGSYMCMLYNKYIEKDDTTAFLYEMNEKGWINVVCKTNKFKLYKDDFDGRTSSVNKDAVFKYIEDQSSQVSQGSTIVSASSLSQEFIKSGIISKDTMYSCLKKLVLDGLIVKEGRGNYVLNEKGGL